MGAMKLEEIYYFSVKKHRHPALYDLAQKIVKISEQNPHDKEEINRRMSLLTKSSGAEHVRQCSNFLAEIGAFNHLFTQDIAPHWVMETSRPMPDLEYGETYKKPVEVKHLNSPRAEHDALFSGQMYSGNVDHQYHIKLQKKISDFIDDTRKKFTNFNKQVNGTEESKGTLYLFFSKSIDAGLLDGIEFEQKMEDRVKAIAEPLAGNDIELIVTDIGSLVE
jgi:hypothetical protein